MNNFETFYYFFGIFSFYALLIILIHDTWDFRKRKQNKLRKFLISKKSKHFGTWCVVLKRKNKKDDVEVLFLTKFFAKRGLKRADNFVRTKQHPPLIGQMCGSFMFKKTKE